MPAATLAMPRRETRRPVDRVPPLQNSTIAIVVILVGEAMLFAGLVGAYLVFRISAHDWPPTDLPRLPLALTIANTLLLLASVVPITGALRAFPRDDAEGIRRGIVVTTAMGGIFLAVQGFEWARLVAHGITVGSSIYGATFYLLIGTHAAHVLGAVTWLAVLAWMASRGTLTAARRGALEMGAVYWYFVCALWVALFMLVYLN